MDFDEVVIREAGGENARRSEGCTQRVIEQQMGTRVVVRDTARLLQQDVS